MLLLPHWVRLLVCKRRCSTCAATFDKMYFFSFCRSLVQQLKGAAGASLCGVSAALSPTMQPLLTLRLDGGSQPGSATEQQHRQQAQHAARLQVAQIPADGDSSDSGHVWVSWPVAAPQQGGGTPAVHLCILRILLPAAEAAQVGRDLFCLPIIRRTFVVL